MICRAPRTVLSFGDYLSKLKEKEQKHGGAQELEPRRTLPPRFARTKERDMTTAGNQATAEAQLRALIEARVEAIRARDIEGLMSNHAPDVVMFDAESGKASLELKP